MSKSKSGFNFRKDDQSYEGDEQHYNSDSSSDDDFDQSIELSHGSLIIDGQVTEYTQIHTDQSCSSERDLLHSIEVSYEGLDGAEGEGEEYVCIDVATDVDPSLMIKKETPQKLQRVDTFDILESAKDFVNRSVSISSTDDFFDDGSTQRMNTRRSRNLLSFSSQTSQISEEEFFEIEEIEQTEEIITYLEEEEEEEEEEEKNIDRMFSYSSADIERYHSLPSGSQYNTKHFFGSPRSAKSEIGEITENIEDLIFSAISSPVFVSDSVEETSYPSSFYTKIKGSLIREDTNNLKTDQDMDIYTNDSLVTQTNMQRRNESFDQEIEISSLDYSSPSILESQEETLSIMTQNASDNNVEVKNTSIYKEIEEDYSEKSFSFSENNKDEEVFVLNNENLTLNSEYEEISVDINVDEDDENQCDNCVDIDFVAKFDKFLEEEYSLEQEVDTQNNIDEIEHIEAFNDTQLYSENTSMSFETPILTSVSSDIDRNTQFTVVACDINIDESKDNEASSVLIEKTGTDLNFEKISVDINIEEDKVENLEIGHTINTSETKMVVLTIDSTTKDSDIELEIPTEYIDGGEMDETASGKNTIENKERSLKVIKGKVYSPIGESIDDGEMDETACDKNTIENKERPLKVIKGKVYSTIGESIDDGEMDETASDKNTIENKERPLKVIKGKVYSSIDDSIDDGEMDETASDKNTIENKERPLNVIKGKVYSTIGESIDDAEMDETASDKNTIENKPLKVIKGKVYSPIEQYAFNYDTSQEVSIFPSDEYSEVRTVSSTSSPNKPHLSRSDTIAMNDGGQKEDYVVTPSFREENDVRNVDESLTLPGSSSDREEGEKTNQEMVDATNGDTFLDSYVITKSMQELETSPNITTHTDADMILESNKQIVPTVISTEDQSLLSCDVECLDESFDIECDSSLNAEESTHLEVDVADRLTEEISESINDVYDDNSSSDESSYRSCDDNDATKEARNILDEESNRTSVFSSKTALDEKMMFDKTENEIYEEDSTSSSSTEDEATYSSSSDSKIEYYNNNLNDDSLETGKTKDFSESSLLQPVCIGSSLTNENVTIEQKKQDIVSNSVHSGQHVMPIYGSPSSDVESSDDTSDESSTSSSDESVRQNTVEILSNPVVENKLAILGATVTRAKSFTDIPCQNESLTEKDKIMKGTLNDEITTQLLSEKYEPSEDKTIAEFPSNPSLDMELFPSSTLEFVAHEIPIELDEHENNDNLEEHDDMIINDVDLSDEVHEDQSSDDLFSSTLNVDLPDNSNHKILIDCDNNQTENEVENNLDSFKIDDSFSMELELQSNPFKLGINQNQNTDSLESDSMQNSFDKSLNGENTIELEAYSDSIASDSTYGSLNVLSNIEERENLIEYEIELSLESGNLSEEMVNDFEYAREVLNDDSSPRISCDFEPINITSIDVENDSDDYILTENVLEDVTGQTEDQEEISSERENKTLSVTQPAANLNEIILSIDGNESKTKEMNEILEHEKESNISSESVIEFTETLADLSSPSTPDSPKSSIDLDISNINSFYIAHADCLAKEHLQLEMDVFIDETDKLAVKIDEDSLLDTDQLHQIPMVQEVESDVDICLGSANKPDNIIEKDVDISVEYNLESTPSANVELSQIYDNEAHTSKEIEKDLSFDKPSQQISTVLNSSDSLENLEEEILVSQVASVECSVEMTFDSDKQTLEQTTDDLNSKEDSNANDFLLERKESATDVSNSDVFQESSILVRPPSVDFISSGNFEEKLESLDFILEECSASTNFKPRKSEKEPSNTISLNETDGIKADDSSTMIASYLKEDFHYIELPRTLSTSSFISSGTLEDELASLDFILESLPDKNLNMEKVEIDNLDSTDECLPVDVVTNDIPVTLSTAELSIEKDVTAETTELSVTDPDVEHISSDDLSETVLDEEVVDITSSIDFDNTTLQIDEINVSTEISLNVNKEDCEDIVASVEEVRVTIPTSLQEEEIDADISIAPQIYIANESDENRSQDLDIGQTENIDADLSTNNAMLESSIPPLSDCSPIFPDSENKITEMIKVHSPIFGNLTIKLTGLEHTENTFSFDNIESDALSQSIEVDEKNHSGDITCDDVNLNSGPVDLPKSEERLKLKSDDATLELDVNEESLEANLLLESSSAIEIPLSITEEEINDEEKINPENIDVSFESSLTESTNSTEPNFDTACLDIKPGLGLDITQAEEISENHTVDLDMGFEKENPSDESIHATNETLKDESGDVLDITMKTPEKDEITKDMFTNCLSTSLNLINDLTLSLDEPVPNEIEIFEEDKTIGTSYDNIEMDKSNEKITIVEDELDAILAQCISLKEGKRDSLIEPSDQKEKDEAILDLSLQDEQESSESSDIEVDVSNENEMNDVSLKTNIEDENKIEVRKEIGENETEIKIDSNQLSTQEVSINNDLTVTIDSTIGGASATLGGIIIQESHSENDLDKEEGEEESKIETEIEIDSNEPSIQEVSIENILDIEESHSNPDMNLDGGKEEDNCFTIKEDISLNVNVEIKIEELEDKEESQEDTDDIDESAYHNSSSSENIDASFPSNGRNSEEEKSDLQPLINGDSDSSSTNLSVGNTLCVENNDLDFDGESRSKLISVIIVESDEEAALRDSCGELPYLDLSIDMSDVSKALDSCVPKSGSNDNLLIQDGRDSTIVAEAENTEVDVTITSEADVTVEKGIDEESEVEEELDGEKKPSLDLDVNVSEESFAAKMDYIFDGFVEPNKRSSKDIVKDMESNIISEHYDVPTNSVFAETTVEEAEKERDDSISALEEALSELRGSIRPNFGTTISKSRNNIEVRVSVVKKDTPSALFEVDWESNFGKNPDETQSLPYDDTYATIDGGLYENIDVVSNTNAIAVESKWPGTDESLETKEKINNSDYDIIDNKNISKNKLSLKRKSRNTSTRTDSEKDHLDEKFELENVETVRKEKIDSKKQKGKKKKKSSFFLCACTRGVHD